MPNQDKTTVIIPAKNEAGTIESVIESVKKYADEVIVIDGHSDDNTSSIARKCGARVIPDNKKGKGAALRIAANEATNNNLVFIDGDNSHSAEDIPKIIAPIINDEADLVITSRYRGGSDDIFNNLDFFLRITGSHIITFLINLRWNTLFTDSQNGFRATKKSVFADLGLSENKTTVEQEMLMKALKKKYRVKEIASHENIRQTGQSKIKLRRVWHLYALCLLKNIF